MRCIRINFKNPHIMKITNIAVILLAVVFTTLASCQKKHAFTNSISDLFIELKDAPQKFRVEAGEFSSIVGKKGTRINFNPRSFRNNNGDIITDGTIDVALIETPKLGDMMRNAVTTKVWMNPSMLRTGGSINLEVTQKGETVIVGEGYGIDFLQDSASTQRMLVFSGVEELVPALGRQVQQGQGQSFSMSSNGGFITWGERGSNTQSGTVIDTASLLNYYMFDDVTSFKWINCDAFYNDQRPKTEIEINLTGKEVGPYGATVFVVYPEINSLVNLYQFDYNDLNKFSFGNIRSAPVGIKARFVAIAKVDGEYYFAKTSSTTVNQNHKQSVQLEKTTVAEIRREMLAF